MNPVSDRITEVAMMKVRNGVLVDEFSTLVNPLVTIPYTITNITGIDNTMVKDAPTAREIARYVREFLGDGVFTAHNAAFDWGFISETVKRETGMLLGNETLCTVKMSRRILPHLKSKSLGHVARELKIRIPERHRASGDAYATALVLVKYLSYLKQQEGFESVEEVLAFQRTRRPG